MLDSWLLSSLTACRCRLESSDFFSTNPILLDDRSRIWMAASWLKRPTVMLDNWLPLSWSLHRCFILRKGASAMLSIMFSLRSRVWSWCRLAMADGVLERRFRLKSRTKSWGQVFKASMARLFSLFWPRRRWVKAVSPWKALASILAMLLWDRSNSLRAVSDEKILAARTVSPLWSSFKTLRLEDMVEKMSTTLSNWFLLIISSTMETRSLISLGLSWLETRRFPERSSISRAPRPSKRLSSRVESELLASLSSIIELQGLKIPEGSAEIWLSLRSRNMRLHLDLLEVGSSTTNRMKFLFSLNSFMSGNCPLMWALLSEVISLPDRSNIERPVRQLAREVRPRSSSDLSSFLDMLRCLRLDSWQSSSWGMDLM